MARTPCTHGVSQWVPTKAIVSVTGDDGSLDYPSHARAPPIIYFGVTTCHQHNGRYFYETLNARTIHTNGGLATMKTVRCSAAPLLLHDDRRADLDPVIEIDHVLIGHANAAR